MQNLIRSLLNLLNVSIITIDRNLTFDSHVSNVCKTASGISKSLSRIKNALDEKQAKLLRKSFSLWQFNYCSVIWMYHCLFCFFWCLVLLLFPILVVLVIIITIMFLWLLFLLLLLLLLISYFIIFFFLLRIKKLLYHIKRLKLVNNLFCLFVCVFDWFVSWAEIVGWMIFFL